MDLKVFKSLHTQLGREALQAAQALNPAEASYLSHYTKLSQTYPPGLSRAALETAILRNEARQKFPQASQMYFTRTALEQATSWEISRYRAERYRALDHLLDLGCSIGSDTASLAAVAFTTGIDLDNLRLAIARENVKVLAPSVQVSFIQADLQQALPVKLDQNTGLFFDPARRENERRAHSVKYYQPPLKIIKEWLKFCPHLGVKISPGVNLQELQEYPAEIEFISLSGELKEAMLWFGSLNSTPRRATVLPGPFTFTVQDELLDTIPAYSGSDQAHKQILPLSEPLAYLVEPDPSILRAGLVQALGLELGAAQLDRDIAYLTSQSQVETPFARTWKIEAWLPFNVKNLRAELRQRGVGKITVKKRGSPIQPDELSRLLRLNKKGQESYAERVLVLTHLRGSPIAIICYTNT